MNSKNIGDVAEYVVIVDLLKRGYVVSSVVGDNAAYDLVVETSKGLQRLQVKSRQPSKGRLLVELYSMQYSSSKGANNRVKQKLYGDAVDVYAIVDAQTLKCYYLPAADVKGLQQISLRLDEPKANVSRCRFAAAYEEF